MKTNWQVFKILSARNCWLHCADAVVRVSSRPSWWTAEWAAEEVVCLTLIHCHCWVPDMLLKKSFRSGDLIWGVTHTVHTCVRWARHEPGSPARWLLEMHFVVYFTDYIFFLVVLLHSLHCSNHYCNARTVCVVCEKCKSVGTIYIIIYIYI